MSDRNRQVLAALGIAACTFAIFWPVEWPAESRAVLVRWGVGLAGLVCLQVAFWKPIYSVLTEGGAAGQIRDEQRANQIAAVRDRAMEAAALRNQTAQRVEAARGALAAADDATRQARKLELDQAIAALELDERTHTYYLGEFQRITTSGSLTPKSSTLQYIVFGGLGLIALVFIMYGIGSTALLVSLERIPTARGLITFLVAVITVTIALVLTLSTVVSDSDEREKRFQQGKEVLTALIGVLGTIVGFYFGNTLDSPEVLKVESVTVSTLTPKEGAPIAIGAGISGGKKPYFYEVKFDPVVKGIDNVARSRSDGAIVVNLTAPAVENDTDVSFVIEASDSEGHTFKYESAGDEKLLHFKK